MRSVVVIPARFQSSRYPGKPLVPLLGKPMILWVAELSSKAVGKDNVYITTEDARIEEVVREAGFSAVITGKDALTGTDRIAEAAEKIQADIYINVQGDEPLVNPVDIIKIRDTKIERMEQVINGYAWLSADEDPGNINTPKLITNESSDLVYMSRVALPGFKDKKCAPKNYKKQVCIYAFTKNELQDFRAFGRKGFLESCEDIEILRFLEMGKKIYMVETQAGSLAVDVPADLTKVESALRKLSG